MLAGRADDDPAVTYRLSYAVRHRTSEEDWLYIDSTNLDELVAARLPTVAVQRRNMLQWFANQVEDDHFGSVRPPPMSELAAVAGVVNGKRVEDLFKTMMDDGYVVGTDEGGYRLTPKAWEQLDRAEGPEAPTAAQAGISSQNLEVARAECPACGPTRRAEVVASHSERNPPDGPIFETTTMSVLRCCGCSTLYARREVIFSENEEQEQDPLSGEWHTVLRPIVSYWPAQERRTRPDWFEQITDETIRTLLDETYGALNNGQHTLSAMGVRAVLDRLFDLAGADPGATFDEKLKWLREYGVVGDQEYGLLRIMTDAGSAASHRGWRPSPEQLATILDATEGTLNRVCVMPARAATLQESVPPRPRRRLRTPHREHQKKS